MLFNFCLASPLFNRLNAELNPICHLLALLGARHILHASRIRVKEEFKEKIAYVIKEIYLRFHNG